MADDDDPRSVRDIWLIFKTGWFVLSLFVGALVLGGAGIIAHFIHEERQDAAIQALKDREVQREREARTERWRKDRERGFSPGISPAPREEPKI